MCFALPKQIKKIDGTTAAMFDGSQVKLGDIQAKPGDYIVAIGPLAVEKISKQKAQKMFALIKKTL